MRAVDAAPLVRNAAPRLRNAAACLANAAPRLSDTWPCLTKAGLCPRHSARSPLPAPLHCTHGKRATRQYAGCIPRIGEPVWGNGLHRPECIAGSMGFSQRFSPHAAVGVIESESSE